MKVGQGKGVFGKIWENKAKFGYAEDVEIMLKGKSVPNIHLLSFKKWKEVYCLLWVDSVVSMYKVGKG